VRDFKRTRQHDRYINILLSHMIVSSRGLSALHIRDESLHYALRRLVRACDLSNKRHRDDHDDVTLSLGSEAVPISDDKSPTRSTGRNTYPANSHCRPRGLRKADRNGAARIRSAQASERTSSLPI